MDGHYSIGAWLIRNREPLCQCRAEFVRVKVKSAHAGVMVWMAADRTAGRDSRLQAETDWQESSRREMAALSPIAWPCTREGRFR